MKLTIWVECHGVMYVRRRLSRRSARRRRAWVFAFNYYCTGFLDDIIFCIILLPVYYFFVVGGCSATYFTFWIGSFCSKATEGKRIHTNIFFIIQVLRAKLSSLYVAILIFWSLKIRGLSFWVLLWTRYHRNYSSWEFLLGVQIQVGFSGGFWKMLIET